MYLGNAARFIAFFQSLLERDHVLAHETVGRTATLAETDRRLAVRVLERTVRIAAVSGPAISGRGSAAAISGVVVSIMREFRAHRRRHRGSDMSIMRLCVTSLRRIIAGHVSLQARRTTRQEISLDIRIEAGERRAVARVERVIARVVIRSCVVAMEMMPF